MIIIIFIYLLVTHSRHSADDDGIEEEMADHRSSVKIKVSSKLRSAEKGNSEFENIVVLQELGGEHTVIALTKFSIINFCSFLCLFF